MIVGVPKEVVSGERRVALVPALVAKLHKMNLEVIVQPGAGAEAGFIDAAYAEAGARLDDNVLSQSDVILKIQPPTAQEAGTIKPGAVLIACLRPYVAGEHFHILASRKVTAFALELMPRITRAQSMDVLSAMSTVSGYKAVLIAAVHLPKFFPLLMTAAGTIPPARVFVIGAGVAGLQAIATARRLGAVVEAFDTRPVVKEQVESLGAKFVELGLETKNAEAKTGYAATQSEEFYRQQRALMGRCIAAADVVITTALVPGQRAPILITAEMVQGMRPGSVIVDLAAEQGGNCELTEPGQDVTKHGVLLSGPTNLPSTIPQHASQMYARIVTNYLTHLAPKGTIQLDLADDLTRGPLVINNGEIVHDVLKTTLAAK
jgi:H+-translocating NAD(P) transhydrogenase subunit alpha